jgi:sensor histidine kinase YesM
MKKQSSLYWICQIAGWFSYGLTILFFASILDKELNPIFYPRLAINLSIGILLTHLLRETMHRFSLRPPMPSNQWWKLFLLLFIFSIINSFSTSYLADILKLYEPGRNIPLSRRFLFSIIFDTPIFLVWMSVYILWHYIEFTNTEEIKKVRLETMIKELELKTIKSQINPHFIFNALNSIRALVDEDPQRARQAITELSNILRSSIQVDKVEITSLEKELDIVKDYLALEYIRFADRLKVVYEVDSNTLSHQIPPMMLQTLVENAIKHGLSKQPGDCTIKIISNVENDKLVLIVQNTGLLQPSEKDGFGLQSTRERLNILYRGQAIFEIYQCEPNKVTAKLVIPISN